MYQVLIADKERLMRDALASMISQIPAFKVVHSVSNSEEAIECCKQEKIDIVFLEIGTIGMCDLEAARHIHMLYPGITLYLISMHRNFDFTYDSLHFVAQAYLSKPIAGSTIQTLLGDFVKEHQSDAHQLDVLLRYINQNNFSGVYYAIPEIVEQICQDKNKKQLVERFLTIGQGLVHSIGSENAANIQWEENFPIHTVLSKSPRNWEIWLLQVVNYVFEQRAIKKCTILKNVFLFINKHLKEPLSLTQITQDCHISQGYLSRLFQQAFHTSVMEYLHMRKVALAKIQLVSTNLRICEIANTLGYNESNYFSKIFKKYENISVQEYRKKHATTI